MRLILTILCAVALVHSSRAQYDYNAILPPSPTAASLGQYGDVPVSLHTGTPNISIPLGGLKGSELELPLSLSYSAKGIKVDENASWVGTGWSLNSGGVITRTVRGHEDGSKPRPTFPLPTDIAQAKNVLVNIQEDFLDPEPDLYFFNFNGYSGSFVLDESGEAVIENAKDQLRIKRDPVNLYKFTITIETGAQYIFDQAENTSYNGATTSSGNSALYLSKIISPTGKEVIDFSYTSEVTRYHSLSRPTKWIRPDDIVLDAYGQPVFSVHTINSLRLTTITTNFGQNVEFTPDPSARQDLAAVAAAVAPKALKEIKFYDQNNITKRYYIFDHETIETSIPYAQLRGTDPPADATTTYANYRLYLKSVKELSGDRTAEKPAQVFSYSGRNAQGKDLLPNKLSPSQDHWGYFNGSSNLDLWPGYSGPFGFYDWEFNAGNIACYADIVYVSRESHIVSGANRNPKYPEMEYGTLNTIKYPTGGKTTFGFEPHKYLYETNKGGYVTKTIESGIQLYLSGSGSQLEISESDQAHLSARFIFEFNVTCWDPSTHETVPCNSPGSQVNFDKFQGNSVALFNSSNQEVIAAKWVPGDQGFWIYRNGVVDNTIGMLQPDENGYITREITNLSLYAGTYTLKAKKDPDCDTDVFGWFYYPKQVTVELNDPASHKLAGGLRVKRVESFDEINNSVSLKTYDYGVGVLMDGPKYSTYVFKGGNWFQKCVGWTQW